MKRYEVVADLQGVEFGMGRRYTAEEWLEQACDWLDADGAEDEDIERYKDYWTRQIKAGAEQELIDDISVNWEIDIQEVKEN